MFKSDIRPQIQQFPPQIFQGDVEIVGTNMGLGIVENVLRGAALYQLL